MEFLSRQHKNRVFIASAQKWSFYHVSTKIEFLSRQHKNPYCFTFRQLHKVVMLDSHMKIIRCLDVWSGAVTLREEQRVRVFENRVLRELCGHERRDLTAEWRKLNSAELHALCSSPNVIRVIKSRRTRWAVHVARMGEMRVAYRMLVRSEGKWPLGRPRRIFEDNINMNLQVLFDILFVVNVWKSFFSFFFLCWGCWESFHSHPKWELHASIYETLKDPRTDKIKSPVTFT